MQQLRSIAFLAYLVLMTLIVGIIGLPTLLGRGPARQLSRIWSRLVAGGLRVIAGISHESQGTAHFAVAPAIVAAKHQSMWETVRLFLDLPTACFVLKEELGRIPFFGWYARATGFIFVDRSAGAKALKKMVDDARDAITAGATHIVIFPEGTRAPVGTGLPYQPGVAALARALELPVIPVAHNSGCFWRHPGITKVSGRISLVALPPISPQTPRAALMAQLEAGIEAATRQLEAKAGFVAPAPAAETAS